MEQLSAQHGRICLVFDGETFPDGLDRLSPEAKILYGSGNLELIVLSAEYCGVLNSQGVTALHVNSWEALDEFVTVRNIKTLHIKAHGHWSAMQADAVFGKWQSEAKLKVIVEAADARWDIQVLKKCAAVIVYSHEAGLRLLGSGLQQSQVIVRPRSLDFPTLPRTQRLMLRKAYGLPEGPMLFARTVSDTLANALRDRWHILTPDANAPQMKNVTRFEASGTVVERGYLRTADALLCNGDSTPLWYLKEALDWSIEVFTTDSEGIEDLRPMVIASADLADIILQLNGYSALVQNDSNPYRDYWAGMQASVKAPQPIVTLYNDLWNEAVKVTQPQPVRAGIFSGRPERILMQNRPDAEECPGGDTVVMHHFAEILRQSGINVDIDHGSNVDYSKYDLVHLFNFALPDVLEGYARKVVAHGKPFVVTALNEDIPEFYLQGVGFARHLMEYVTNGQRTFTWNQHSRLAAGSAQRFNNDWVAAHADRIICCGAQESATVLRDYPSAKVAEVKFAISRNIKGNRETMYQAYGVRDYVLCVGRLEFRKNQLGILKALEHTDHTVVFATGGFSYSPEYGAACRMFKRKGRTIFLERLSEQDLADVYAGARVHALPSWYELPGLVSLEAARYGAEIVVTDQGTIRDYVGGMAHYCEPDSIDSIRNAIEEAYRTPRAIGLATALEGLTWETSTKALIDVYADVLRNRSDQKTAVTLTNQPGKQPTQFQSLASTLNVTPVSEKLTPVPPFDAGEYERFLEAGENAAKNRDYEVAERELSKAIGLSGGTPRAYRSLGAVYFAQLKYQDALAEFEKAVRAGGEDGRTYCGYGMSLLAVDRVEDAHKTLLRSIELDPYEAITIYHLVQSSYRLKRFDDLLAALSRYCAKKADDLDMRFCLAGALFRSGDYTRANQENQEILRQKPAHNGARELQEHLNSRLKSEREITTKVVEADVPPRKEDLLHVSSRYAGTFNDHDIKLGDLEEMKRKREFDKVKEGATELLKNGDLRSDQVLCAQLYYGEAVLLSGQVEEGIRLIKDLFDRHGNDQKVICSYAATLCFKGEWEQAAGLFEKVLKENSRNDIALAGLGGCFQQKGDSEKAWDCFRQAATINVECKRALLGLIQLGHEKKRYVELEFHLKKYLDLHSADLDFVYALAGCLFAQEKYEEARDRLHVIRIFDPSNERMNELLKAIDERVGTQETMPQGAGGFGYKGPLSHIPVM